MKRILASLALATLFLMAVASGGAAQTPAPQGIISGQVVNGTAGAALPPGLTVTLQGFKGTEFLPSQTATADAEGRFQFSGLETGSDYSYIAYTEYLGIQYGTDALKFDSGQTQLDATVFIYETTTSDEAISISRIHYIITVSAGMLAVDEVQSFSNSGDRTYIGAEPVAGARRTTVRFAPPPQAQDVQVDEGADTGRFVQTDDGFADTLPVIPGQSTLQVILSYVIPYDPASTRLTTTFLYPTKAVNVFLSDSGVEMSSERMIRMGTMGAGAQAYIGYVGQDFAVGDTLTLEFKGAAKAGTTTAAPAGGMSTTGYILIAGGLALLLMALALAYPALRRRQPSAAVEPTSAPCDDECEELLAAIADLDDLFEAGDLDEETYRRRRQALKARLLEIQAEAQE
ncbi:MAG: hypothetical protein QHH80_02830 [Anaerolineae bacterium]|nr:hypothetical protein [Anaerolineae bacterium]